MKYKLFHDDEIIAKGSKKDLLRLAKKMGIGEIGVYYPGREALGSVAPDLTLCESGYFITREGKEESWKDSIGKSKSTAIHIFVDVEKS